MAFRNLYSSILITGDPGGQRIVINAGGPGSEIDLYSGVVGELQPAAIYNTDGHQLILKAPSFSGAPSGVTLQGFSSGGTIGDIVTNVASTGLIGELEDDSGRQFLRTWQGLSDARATVLLAKNDTQTTDVSGVWTSNLPETINTSLSIGIGQISSPSGNILSLAALSTTQIKFVVRVSNTGVVAATVSCNIHYMVLALLP